MGFFSDLFDMKKTYTEQELWRYFNHEIFGTLHYEDHPEKITTNINEILGDKIKGIYPKASKWDFEKINSYNVKKVNDGTYKLTFKGRVNFIMGAYGELLANCMYYEVTIYTDQYAKLTDYNGAKSAVRVFKDPPRY